MTKGEIRWDELNEDPATVACKKLPQDMDKQEDNSAMKPWAFPGCKIKIYSEKSS